MTTPTETNTPHGPGEVPEPPASEHARKAARHVEWDAAPDAVRPASASASARVESSAPRYPGTGTRGDPFVVDWDLGDAENPYNWSTRRKWAITSQVRAPSSSSSCVVLGGADGVVLGRCGVAALVCCSSRSGRGRCRSRVARIVGGWRI